MAYEWIKKLTKDADKKKSKKFEDYVDKEKLKDVKESFSDRFKKLKEKLKGK